MNYTACIVGATTIFSSKNTKMTMIFSRTQQNFLIHNNRFQNLITFSEAQAQIQQN